MQQYAYLKLRRVTGCGDSTRTQEKLYNLVDKLEKEIQLNFQKALVRDASLTDSWFQWGILLFQEQDQGLMQSKALTDVERMDLLDRAIKNEKRASELKDRDPYIWYLLGQAWEEKSRIPGAEACRDARQAIQAPNRSIEIAGPGDAGANARFLLDKINKTGPYDQPCT